MKPRVSIFISGVSAEFGSFRDAVENEIEMKGCFAENQPGFPPDYREVEQMLRRKISDCDAMIHLVGSRFGAEPKIRPPGVARRSYTQMEFDIAQELDIPVYRFLAKNPSVRDAPQAGERPEDAEAVALQNAHYQTVQQVNNLYYFFSGREDLRRLAAETPLVQCAEFKADDSRVGRYAPERLVGREEELELLADAWGKARRAEPRRPHVLTFVALGGEGKTSLVARWAANLAHVNWPGCDGVFAWSFYSQGTRDQSSASSDLFINEALRFFGDPDMAASSQGGYEKGRRLAQLVGRSRALLILDGLEPLQYPPTSPMAGELKDAAMAPLLRGLAANNKGLCIVTTRYTIADLNTHREGAAPEVKVLRLSTAAGVDLLRSLGVHGTLKEYEQLVEDVKGHALTLNLLGKYLHDAYGGDIRQRDRVKLSEADSEETGGHAFHVLDAYVKSIRSKGERGERAVALWQLLGFFDRPASADCIDALLQPPAIAGLTDAIADIGEAQRNLALQRLEDARLLTVNREAGSDRLLSLDAHPLIREYFAVRLRTKQPEAWKAGHRRLFEHLCGTTKDKPRPTLEDLQPLYQAVVHGCQAGMQQQACLDVYHNRICRKDRQYSMQKLAAFGADLGAVACFFDEPWHRLLPGLSEVAKIWFLNQAAFMLRAMGRLTEAIKPMRAAVERTVVSKDWQRAAGAASNLSELEMALGETAQAAADADQSVTYADVSGHLSEQVVSRAGRADILNQAGRQDEAQRLFREAEQLQAEDEPRYPLLYSLRGFEYCDLLLTAAQRAAWQQTLIGADPCEPAAAINLCRSVAERATRILGWAEGAEAGPLSVALERLTLGRAVLYEAVLAGASLDACREVLDQAVDDLRRARQANHLPRGLLTRAWLRALAGARTGTDSATEDLDEARDIAQRGPMPLHMADIHLYRARLFFREKAYPWTSPAADLEAAEKLINACGYHRRDEELADAKKAIIG